MTGADSISCYSPSYSHGSARREQRLSELVPGAQGQSSGAGGGHGSHGTVRLNTQAVSLSVPLESSPVNVMDVLGH